jgi:hypothetical protein
MLSILAVPLLAAGCAPKERPTDSDPTAGAPPATVAGEPRNCINSSEIRQTLVRTDRVIDFEIRGGKTYRNILTQRCPGLAMERAITYETSINQLCSAQIVYVLENVGGRPRRGAGCSLSQFVPVEYKRDAK